MATNHIVVELGNEAAIQNGVKWWEELAASGGEGMGVKPYQFISRNKNKLLQPAVKRRREYLRIIYRPEYTLQQNIQRLKKRFLSKKKRRLWKRMNTFPQPAFPILCIFLDDI